MALVDVKGTKSKTLYLLVTCSMDVNRANLARAVIQNLKEQNEEVAFFRDLLIFDNNSKYQDHFKDFPVGVKVAYSNINIGYWSAIYWVLKNYQKIFQRNYQYIYIIESDLYHFGLRKISDCELFLDKNSNVGSVRTQEFSVRCRFLYDKKYAWFPWPKKNSVVSQRNAITNEKVWFKKLSSTESIWVTNFHTKLPALNRMSAMVSVFDRLAASSTKITEIEFMSFYHDIYKLTGLLDGGAFRILNDINSPGLSGSYSPQEVLDRSGYRGTRVDQIIVDGFDVKVV
ncbi:hypothetical protein [Polynucleobacter victoriensis]|uniref:Core-2/I-Branching enzyme n=1 Tax=Polynucleobacter victoriensis TaxID=2049319 RepID=A0A212T8I5_9BURK|nr:hypothetical protein [Polynucleobacter victoriensis]SNC62170.1 hypothetical protein SAMN06295916_0623 [Polynucleobacter victoriensis]